MKRFPTAATCIPCPNCGAHLSNAVASERHGAYVLRARECTNGCTETTENYGERPLRVFTIVSEEVIPVGEDPLTFAWHYHQNQESEAQVA